MRELPNPEVPEYWEEKVKAWRDVQTVTDWIQSDPDLYATVMKVHHREVTVEDCIAHYEANLAKRREGGAGTR